MENKKSNDRATIVLKKQLPRVEAKSKRWFINGKRHLTEHVMQLLIDAGHNVIWKDNIEFRIPKKYKGIKFQAHSGGLILEPHPDDYMELVDLLIKDGYFLRDCSLPRI